MSFVRNAAGVLATRVGNIAVGVAASVVLARWLSVEDRGLYAVATTFAGVALLLGLMGWHDAAIYRVRRARAEVSRVAGAALIAAFTISAVGIAICFVAEPFITERFLDDAPSTVFLLAVGLFPVQLLGAYFAAIARAIDRFDLFNYYRIGTELLVLAGLVGTLVVAGGGLLAALATAVAARGAATLVFVAIILSKTGLTLRAGRAELGAHLRFGMKSYAQGIVGELHERVDVFAIAFVTGDPTLVAFYTIAAVVVGRLKTVPEAVGSALYPELAGLPPKEAASFVARVSRQSFAVVVAMVVGLQLVAGWLIPLLYGEAYAVAVEPMRILLFGMAVHTIYRVVARWFTAVDRQRANIITQAISAPLNLVLDLWWIPILGVAGAAWASTVSYFVEAALILVIFRQTTGIKINALIIPRREDLEAWGRRLRTVGERLRARFR